MLSSPLLVGYMVAQYAIFGIVMFWWFYKSRVKRGFRVQFVAEVQSGTKGAYLVDGTDLSIGELGDVIPVAHGCAENAVIFLSSREVKAGDDLVSYLDKSYMIPWDEIAFREFGYEYMIINVTTQKSLTFGGESNHFYSPADVDNVSGGKMFSNWFRGGQAGQFLLTVVFALAFGCIVSGVVGWFLHGYLNPTTIVVNATGGFP